jgi:cobalt/nickel transport system permease protein
MHMADALLSPAVGGAMLAASGATAAYCAKKVRDDLDQSKVPLMGVLGAFIFASQMLNFTIPGTGSSGHLGGGLVLAILLGPYAAFLVMASVLTVQALFFADGGLLALGSNMFNLGFFPAFIAYPFVYKLIVGPNPTRARVTTGSIVGAIVGLQLGALAVVLETTLSGISELPFHTFVLMMLPIHLGIGVVEGLVTAAVVLFVMRARPEILDSAATGNPLGKVSLKPVVIGLVMCAVLAGTVFSWFASTNPDGLEWSMAKVTGTEEIAGVSGASVHNASAALQEKTAFMPDYGFKEAELAGETVPEGVGGVGGAAAEGGTWPAMDPGTSAAGIVGAGLTLAIALAIGFALKLRASARANPGV